MIPRTIVVPLDGSARAEQALEPALVLARGFAAELVLARSTWHRPPDAEEAYLARRAEQFDLDERSCSTLTGFAANTIPELVSTRTDALLCLATRGHTGVGRLVLGSVAADILGYSTAPAVLVGPAFTITHLRTNETPLLYCFDGSPAASNLETTVADWAHRLHLPVRAATVLHRDGEFLGAMPADQVRREAAQVVERLRGRGLRAEHVVLDGLDPGRVLVDDAVGCQAALIVAGSTATGTSSSAARLTRAALGSTSERIVRHATVPVLVSGR